MCVLCVSVSLKFINLFTTFDRFQLQSFQNVICDFIFIVLFTTSYAIGVVIISVVCAIICEAI